MSLCHHQVPPSQQYAVLLCSERVALAAARFASPLKGQFTPKCNILLLTVTGTFQLRHQTTLGFFLGGNKVGKLILIYLFIHSLISKQSPVASSQGAASMLEFALLKTARTNVPLARRTWNIFKLKTRNQHYCLDKKNKIGLHSPDTCVTPHNQHGCIIFTHT